MSHYKPYPTYKDSGVEWLGAMPEHWQLKRLRYVASLNPSPDWKALESQQSEYPFLPMEAVSEVGGLDTSRRKALDECRSGYTYFAEGDVAYAKVTPCFENGKGAVIRGLEGNHGFGTTELTVLRPTAINRDFLYALTYADCFRQPGASEMLGSGGLKRVPDDFTRDYRAGIPPSAEQTAITTALDRETARIDALIAKKTRFIELLKEKRQALITHAVTKGLDPNVKMKDSGVEWIGKVPEHWSLGRLRDFVQAISTGPFGTALGSDDYVSNGVPVINPSHIAESGCVPDETVTVDQDKASQLAFWAMRPGDIVTARRGELGRAAIIGDKQAGWICGTGSIRIRPNASKIASEYVHAALQATYARRWLELKSVGSTMPNLSEKLIGDLPIALPPTIREQQSLLLRSAEEATGIDALIAKVQHSVALLKERRSALITAAVTGQIDLRESVQ
jgi:type I restriction enzyme, S subunit